MLVLFAVLLPVLVGYELPAPYRANPPYSYGHYCNASDPYWWEGFLWVDLWGALDIAPNSTIRVTQFDAITIHDQTRLTTQFGAKIILRDWDRLDINANLTLRNFSSLVMWDHCALEAQSDTILETEATLEMAHFAYGKIDGELRMGRRSKLIIGNFSTLQIAQKGKIVLNEAGEMRIEEFSSILIGENAGLKIESNARLTLRNRSRMILATDTWLRLTRNVTIQEKVYTVDTTGDRNVVRSMGFDYPTETEFDH